MQTENVNSSTRSAADVPRPVSTATRGRSSSLPFRDLILLPLLILVTLVIVSGAGEWLCLSLFPASDTTTIPCLVVDDPHAAVHAIPNTVCSQKCYESALTRFSFNECGHRTSLPCGPPPAGTFRIVLVGSSLAEGMWVPVQQTFAAQLPAKLSDLTGSKIDLYNEAMQWGTPRSVDLRLNEVFPVKPDMVLWTVTPYDIENVRLRVPYIPNKQEQDDGEVIQKASEQAAPSGFTGRVLTASRKYGSPAAFFEATWNRAIDPLRYTRTSFAMQHLLFKSQNQFMKQTLGQKSAGFLEDPTPKQWQQQLDYFDQYLADVQSRLQAKGIPLVVTLLPNRPQAVLLSKGTWPAGYNPYRLGDELKALAAKHGATYVDILPDYRDVQDPDQYFYTVDGHMNSAGHAVLTNVLAKELVKGSMTGTVPAFQSAKEGRKALGGELAAAAIAAPASKSR